jgi:hypothetical protein
VVKTITSKQDRPRARTAADIEQKYNFGQTFAEVFNLITDAQKAAEEAKKAIDSLDHEQIFNLLTDNGRIQGVYRGDDGNVYINATYIKSGKLAAEYIDAENLSVKSVNITGAITFEQLSDDLQSQITSTPEFPDRIYGTYIDNAQIMSPTITGNNIRALQSLSVCVTENNKLVPKGHFGLAYGKDAEEKQTYGVALACASMKDDYGLITYETEGQYVIVTDSGVRLQSLDNNIAVTNRSIYLSIKNDNDQRLKWIHLDSSGAFYNDQEIATKYDLKNASVSRVEGTLQLFDTNGTSTGWVGSGRGQASDGSTTYGVALASSTTAVLPDGSYSLDFDSAGRYVLATTDGVKLKSGENTRITLTDTTISVRTQNGATFRYNGSDVVTLDTLHQYGLI